MEVSLWTKMLHHSTHLFQQFTPNKNKQNTELNAIERHHRESAFRRSKSAILSTAFSYKNRITIPEKIHSQACFHSLEFPTRAFRDKAFGWS